MGKPTAFLLTRVHPRRYAFKGRTETIWDELNPKWVRSFILGSSSRSDAILRVTVYDRDARSNNLTLQAKIGSAKCELWELLHYGDQGRKLSFVETKRGSVTLIGELFPDSTQVRELVLGRCKFRNLSRFAIISTLRPYITIFRRRSNSEWAPVYRSVIRRPEKTANVDNGSQTICLRGDHIELRIVLRMHRLTTEHPLIGAIEISLDKLRKLEVGKKIPLLQDGNAAAQMTVTDMKVGDAFSRFEFEISFSKK